MKIYAIWDAKANAIQPQLYPLDNDAVAKRAFASALANPGQQFALMAKYPDDFYLQCLGELDQQSTGKVIPEEGDGRICCLAELLKVEG